MPPFGLYRPWMKHGQPVQVSPLSASQLHDVPALFRLSQLSVEVDFCAGLPCHSKGLYWKHATIEGASMTDVERLGNLLMRSGGLRHCDECLARALGFRSPTRVLRAAAELAQSGRIRRETTECSRRSRTRSTIRALWVGV